MKNYTKLINNKRGYVSIEIVAIGGVILLAGLIGVSSFVKQGKNASQESKDKVTEALEQANGGSIAGGDLGDFDLGGLLPGIPADKVELTQLQIDAQTIHEQGITISMYPTTVNQYYSSDSAHPKNDNEIADVNLRNKYDYNVTVGLTESGIVLSNTYYASITGEGDLVEMVSYSKSVNDEEWEIEDCVTTVSVVKSSTHADFLVPNYDPSVMKCTVRN